MEKKKKGFTLVELLVVIAILAILAGVSVVGYLSFTKKANISNDISLTKQMNTILEANEALGKPNHPSEINKQLKENGLDLTKINTYTKGYSYVWDKKSNSIFLLDELNNVVSPENQKDEDHSDTYKIVHNNDEINNIGDYAIYIASNFSDKEAIVSKTSNIDSDFDTVTLKSNGNEVFNINTNSFESAILNIDSPKGEVNHYGKAKTVNVLHVADNSYNLYGSVSNLKLHGGHAHVKGQAAISYIFIENNNVKVTIDNQVIEPEKINVIYDETVEESSVNISAPQTVVQLDKNVVAKNKDRTYTTLDAAYKEANVNETITLVKSVNLDYTFDKNVIIDGLGINSINGTSIIKNGTFNNIIFTGDSINRDIYTIGNATDGISITLNSCITQYPVKGSGKKTITHIMNGNNATININNSKFINNPENNGLIENVPEWSFGLSFGTQGTKGVVNINQILFEGAFRTMLPSINGNVNVSNSVFKNTIYSINENAGGSQYEATCITTGDAKDNKFNIINNTFDNAGAFYFQVSKNVNFYENVIKFDVFEHYIQLRGNAGAPLDLSRNKFIDGGKGIIIIDISAAPVIMPVNTKLIAFWVWNDTPKEVKPSDYYDYIYWYNEDGSRTFAPTSTVAYDEFMKKSDNITFQEGKDTMIWNN